MNSACRKESLVYYTNINYNDKNYTPKLYKGSHKTSFKKRYLNRVLELKNEGTKATDILEDKRNIQVP